MVHFFKKQKGYLAQVFNEIVCALPSSKQNDNHFPVKSKKQISPSHAVAYLSEHKRHSPKAHLFHSYICLIFRI